LRTRQVAAMGLDQITVPLPWPCSNDDYEARMQKAVAQLKSHGITHMIFGDLFLEDVRQYREAKLAGTGITPIFPLWGRATAALAREMIAQGFDTRIVTVDLSNLDASFAGRKFDESFLADLPPGIDPCGENGEFHSAVVAGPIFDAPIPVQTGETTTRDGFAYADLIAC
ncbi:ATP-binding protein, partial [Escherichia coli]|nr:ATP-binding protein [Escherichia coli]